MTGPGHHARTALEQLETDIVALCDAADAAGVGMSAWREPDYLWLFEISRSPAAPKGSGREWIGKLANLAHRHDLPLRLCCTHWNDRLTAHYRSMGFSDLYIEEEELFMELATPGT